MTSEFMQGITNFGPFQLDTMRRTLHCGGEEVRVGGRAMDILLALSKSVGNIVSRDTLIAAAWPDTFVHESNLKVTIAQLRRILRDKHPSKEYINTVIGRGYRLGDGMACLPNQAGGAPLIPLPPASTIIGRDADVSLIAETLAECRLTTIAGAGGLGKTTAAIAAAHRFVAGGDYAAAFVDLARVSSGEFVVSSIASAIGVSSAGASPGGLDVMMAMMKKRKILIVLDTCEHLHEAVAQACNMLIAKTENLRILATSRHVLQAQDEHVFWLPALSIPPVDRALTADHLLQYSAAQLLAVRVQEKSGVHFRGADIPAVVEICRRLDGAPLAIELISLRFEGRTATMVLSELEDRFRTTRQASPGGPLRQQTLRLTLEWSYALLTRQEAKTLRALSIFAGAFTLESVVQLMADSGLSSPEVADVIASLQAKSMISPDRSYGGMRHKLLDCTRAFAGELLLDHDESQQVSASHARLQCGVLKRASAEQASLPPGSWRLVCSNEIDDLRKAVDWALHRGGNPLLGAELVAAGLPVWEELSQGEESCRNCEAALAALEQLRHPDPALELALLVGLATGNSFLSRPTETVNATFDKALALARANSDPDAECQVLGSLAIYSILPGAKADLSGTLDAMRSAALRAKNPFALWEQQFLRSARTAELGQFIVASEQLDGVRTEMREYFSNGPLGIEYRKKLMIETCLAASTWYAGKPGVSQSLFSEILENSWNYGHELTLVYCLSYGALSTFVELGDFRSALYWSDILSEMVDRCGLVAWFDRAICYRASIAALSGNERTPDALCQAFEGLVRGNPQGAHDGNFATLSRAMLEAGFIDETIRVLDFVFERGPRPWIVPELYRIKAGTELALGHADKAETTFRLSLAEAGKMEVRGFALRAALDLASLLRDQGNPVGARQILSPIYNQFTNGFDTHDVIRARQLLESLA